MSSSQGIFVVAKHSRHLVTPRPFQVYAFVLIEGGEAAMGQRASQKGGVYNGRPNYFKHWEHFHIIVACVPNLDGKKTADTARVGPGAPKSFLPSSGDHAAPNLRGVLQVLKRDIFKTLRKSYNYVYRYIHILTHIMYTPYVHTGMYTYRIITD